MDTGALDALTPEVGVVCRLLDCLPSLPFPGKGGIIVSIFAGLQAIWMSGSHMGCCIHSKESREADRPVEAWNPGESMV